MSEELKNKIRGWIALILGCIMVGSQTLHYLGIYTVPMLTDASEFTSWCIFATGISLIVFELKDIKDALNQIIKWKFKSGKDEE
jgi:uncharacterized membrane protein YecN with MAPEG domain